MWLIRFAFDGCSLSRALKHQSCVMRHIFSFHFFSCQNDKHKLSYNISVLASLVDQSEQTNKEDRIWLVATDVWNMAQLEAWQGLQALSLRQMAWLTLGDCRMDVFVCLCACINSEMLAESSGRIPISLESCELRLMVFSHFHLLSEHKHQASSWLAARLAM